MAAFTDRRDMVIGHFRCTYDVGRTGREFSLPPVRLCVDSGAVKLQDYLTPDEADLLGDALKGMAAEARADV